MLMVLLMLLLLLSRAAKFPCALRLAHKSNLKNFERKENYYRNQKRKARIFEKVYCALSFLFLDSLALSSRPVVNEIRSYSAWQAPASLVA